MDVSGLPVSRRARPTGCRPVRPPVLYAPSDRRLSTDELPAVEPLAPDRDGVVLSYHSSEMHEGLPVIDQPTVTCPFRGLERNLDVVWTLGTDRCVWSFWMAKKDAWLDITGKCALHHLV
ncbi:hypothetical protein [Frankia gtarii]|uniref:hypothetical protein n=1 Tax=Frankia gtarii TaxID=2950102 RepID=UPI0021BE1CDD|nr:hypothetical protein [Frankia gtarii]